MIPVVNIVLAWFDIGRVSHDAPIDDRTAGLD
jgi:hypothetical protein